MCVVGVGPQLVQFQLWQLVALSGRYITERTAPGTVMVASHDLAKAQTDPESRIRVRLIIPDVDSALTRGNKGSIFQSIQLNPKVVSQYRSKHID